ncbi:MAG TPA: nuclear transport factor 2 family protein [Candidatus Binataceae bacterium]|jgi:ketosteroid isomerase-like protein
MSAQEEIKRAVDQIIAAATKGDFAPFITALDDDVEIFDHVPYRFDNKESFLEYLQSTVAGAESTTFSFHQPSYRAINETTGVINSYDRLATTPKGGGAPRVQSGRTTMVLAKRESQWKIVSAHFSPLPKE